MRQSDFITRVRQSATKIIEARDELVALQKEWEEWQNVALEAKHFDGENSCVGLDEIMGVFVTLDALQALLANGHGTNLQKARW